MEQSIVALLTDFGIQDRYVGIMKGVMRSICSNLQFIDISHEIAPQNVRQAAFQLMDAYQYFPIGTVFLVVVDPGVGSTRRPIAVQTGQYSFVAPDNGVLSYTLNIFDSYNVVELDNSGFWLDTLSHTFHGRDIFAPIAAHLSNGRRLDELGTVIESISALPAPILTVEDRVISGEVVDIDRFGNIITSVGRFNWITENRLTLNPYFGIAVGTDVHVVANEASTSIGSHSIVSIKASYSEVKRGDVLALIGSSGFLEIAVNQGNAASRFDIAIGDPVTVEVGDIDAAILD